MIRTIQATGFRDPSQLPAHDIRQIIDGEGALLLRGFDFDVQALEVFTHRFCEGFHTPATRADRRQPGDSYSTEVFRDNYILFAHAEGAYKPYPTAPTSCFFLCLTPPDAAGGETTLIDGVSFVDRLPQDLRARFNAEGMRYAMQWDEARWRDEFGVDSAAALTALLDKLPGVIYSLHPDGKLDISCAASAITKTRSGQDAFATGLLAHLPHCTHPRYAGKPVYTKPSNGVFFGNGDAVDDDTINALIDIQDSIAYAHRWQARDLLFIDNTRYMHGRTATDVPCTRVLVSRFGMLTAA